jgi:hypothetical protein
MARQSNYQKMRHKIGRIHLYYAMVVNPGWRYNEMLAGICERLSNSDLKYLIFDKKPAYIELKDFAIFELYIKRKILREEQIHEDREAIERHYRKAKARL